MSLFRSEAMKYYKVSMPREMAWDVLNELGGKGLNQFVDQNEQEPMFQRKYAGVIKRCDEIHNQIQAIQAALTRFNIPIEKCDNYKEYLRNLEEFMKTRNKSEVGYLEEVENEIESQHKKMAEQVDNFDKMKEQENYLKEYRKVLIKSEHAVDNYLQGKKEPNTGEYELGSSSRQLKQVFGVVARENIERFKRIVFRASKGSVLIYTYDFDEDLSSPDSNKVIFILTFQDSPLKVLDKKIQRINEALGVKAFDVPMDRKKFKGKLEEIEGKSAELEQSLGLTEKHIREQLQEYSYRREDMECSYIEHLAMFLVKEKSLYMNMNLLKHNEYDYTGYCWVAKQDEDSFKTAINQLQRQRTHVTGVTYTSLEDEVLGLTPPTYFKTNAFTGPFQEIVNTYGIPRYGEINPGLFAVAFFPFLFGVMFGDIGHGGMLFLFGLYLIWNADNIKEDSESSLKPLVEMRYLLTIMGFFGTYSGFIYNEFLALPWDLFGTCYENQGAVAVRMGDCVYPFGMDPKWFIASNELSFFNSLKMKQAVIIGVLQMSFGVILKGLNAIRFGMPLDFFFEFIPQLTFMMITFGYMCFCIIYKWLTPWETLDLGVHPPPGIINIMINMPLKLGSTEGQPLYDMTLQENVQFYFFLLALLMVPVMLFVKPLILLCQHSGQDVSKQDQNEPLLEAKTASHGSHGGHGEVFEFGEIFVHQVIETIEFVLGSISNTASYLRLWALSLAHGQLSKVFFEKTIGGGIESGSLIMTFVGFFMFANITFAVIMCMDMMECFLHALRLQWVEFQNKFFKADGYKFAPFDFAEDIKQSYAAY